jgi:hypothetical protein
MENLCGAGFWRFGFPLFIIVMALLSSSLEYNLIASESRVGDIWEDPTLSVKMKLSADGVLYIRGQFIEATRSYIDPIPPVSGSITFDLFNTYTSLARLNGLNSGSNEWNGVSDFTFYVSRESYWGLKAYDTFESYVSGTHLSSSTGLQGGSGSWSDLHAYFGKPSRWGMALDTFEYYTAGLAISGSASLTEPGADLWRGSWIVATNVTGSIT